MNEEKTESAYDKWNISVVICDTGIPLQSTKSWWRPYNIRIDDFKLTNRSPLFSSFLVNSNPHQRNHDRKHKLRNIVSTEINQCCFRWMRISQSNCSIHIKLNYLPIKPIFVANCYRKIYYNNL